MCKSCDLGVPRTDPAARSWVWQYCSEFGLSRVLEAKDSISLQHAFICGAVPFPNHPKKLAIRGAQGSSALSNGCQTCPAPTVQLIIPPTGYFQLPNLGPNQIVSKYWSIEANSATCNYQFPDGRSSGLLAGFPRAEETNARFGGWTIRPSNNYWSVGQWNPWRVLSVFSQEEDFSPSYTVTQDILNCGESTAEDTVFGYVGVGGLHNFDLVDWDAEDRPGQISRQYFYSALNKRLPYFHVGNQTTAEDTDIEPSSPTTLATTSSASSAVTFAKALSAFISMALLTALSFFVSMLSFYPG
jgi:hypothetical protein